MYFKLGNSAELIVEISTLVTVVTVKIGRVKSVRGECGVSCDSWD